MTSRALFGLFCLLWSATSVQAQRLVAASSDPHVSITSNFTGDEITFFGNIEHDFNADASSVTDNYHLVISVRGPSATHVTRRKTNQFGIWLNGEEVAFERFPSFYRVLSDLPLDQVAPAEELKSHGLALDAAPYLRATGKIAMEQEFNRELIRLMKEKELYKNIEHGVTFHSDTFYSARIDLPAHVPNGNYLALTHLFQNGKVVAKKAQRFEVRTVGVERFIASSAKEFSFFYGLVCVLLAIFTGWLSGVAFRR